MESSRSDAGGARFSGATTPDAPAGPMFSSLVSQGVGSRITDDSSCATPPGGRGPASGPPAPSSSLSASEASPSSSDSSSSDDEHEGSASPSRDTSSPSSDCMVEKLPAAACPASAACSCATRNCRSDSSTDWSSRGVRPPEEDSPATEPGSEL